jgi:uncharacterized protein
MFIEIRELELHPVDFQKEFSPGVIDFGADLHQLTSLSGTGRAQLVEEHHGKHQVIKDIRLNGRVATSIELACARCLEPVVQNVDRTFDLLYRPLGSDAGKEEMSVTAVDAEIGYYQGNGLELEDALREQVILALPLRALCREDCKGLCPQCGTNLNTEQCSCAEPVQDPRWEALKELRDKLNH